MTDDRQRRRAWRAALAVGGACVACLVLAVTAVALRPRQFTTYQDAIGHSLQQRGIGYNVIYINRAWPDTVNNIVYGANLDVELAGGRHVPGRLECRSGRKACYFSLASLGIVYEPLPDLVPARELPEWASWAERQWAELAGSVIP